MNRSMGVYSAECGNPQVGRFLSADPVVQTAGGSQAYNAYSYALNNPLKYTDPTGYTYEGAGAPPQGAMGNNNFDAFVDSYVGKLNQWAGYMDQIRSQIMSNIMMYFGFSGGGGSGGVSSNGRTKGMNFFVAHTFKYIMSYDTHQLKKNGKEKIGVDWALMADVIKAYIMNIVSLGKLKIVHADTPSQAVTKLKTRLGNDGYIENMILDYHSDDPIMGVYGIVNSTDFQSLDYAFKSCSTVLLGHCQAGIGNGVELLANMWKHAVVIGNMAPSSTANFVTNGSFTGLVRDKRVHIDYYNGSNTAYIGLYKVSNGYSTQQTDRLVMVDYDGEIMILLQHYSMDKRDRLTKRGLRRIEYCKKKDLY